MKIAAAEPPSAGQFRHDGVAVLTLLFLVILLNAPRLASGNLLFSFGGFNGWPTALYQRLAEGDVLYQDVVWPLPPLVTWMYGAVASVLGPGPLAEGAVSLACQIAIALTTFVGLRALGASRIMVISIAATQAAMSVLAHETLLYNSVSLAFGWLAIVLLIGKERRTLGLFGAGVAVAACGFAKQSIGGVLMLAIVAGLWIDRNPSSGERGKKILIFAVSTVGAALLFTIGVSATASINGFWQYVVVGGAGAKGGFWTVIGNTIDFLRLGYPRFQLPALVGAAALGVLLPVRPSSAPVDNGVQRVLNPGEKRWEIMALAVLAVCGLTLSLRIGNPWLAGVGLLQFGILIGMPAVVGFGLGAGIKALVAGYPSVSILLFGSLGLAIGRCLSGHMVFNYEAVAIGFVPLSFILASRLMGTARTGVRAGLLLACIAGAVTVASVNSLHLDQGMRVPVWEGEIIESPVGQWRVSAPTAKAVSKLRDLVGVASGGRSDTTCHVFGDPLVSIWLGCRERSLGLVWYTDMLPDNLLKPEQALLVKHPPEIMVIPFSPVATNAVRRKLQLIRNGSAAEALYDTILGDIAEGRYRIAGSIDVTGMNGYGTGPVEMLVLRRIESSDATRSQTTLPRLRAP